VIALSLHVVTVLRRLLYAAGWSVDYVERVCAALAESIYNAEEQLGAHDR
jgi:hypothetical protein